MNDQKTDKYYIKTAQQESKQTCKLTSSYKRVKAYLNDLKKRKIFDKGHTFREATLTPLSAN